MPHKHKSIYKNYKGITNLYSNSDGLMNNARAENVVQMSMAKKAGMAAKWIYGRSRSNNFYSDSAIDFDSDLTVCIYSKDGSSITRGDAEKQGLVLGTLIAQGRGIEKQLAQ